MNHPVRKLIVDIRSRPPMERMLTIHHAIQSGNMPNATGLARDMEVSTKSIYRDLDFMRDRLMLPISFDEQKNGYFYTQKVDAFPTCKITEGELLALFVAEKALQQYRGTSFEKPLVSAFGKMLKSLPKAIVINLEGWSDAISFRTTAESVLNLKVFKVLSHAVIEHEQIKLDYRKPGTLTPESRIVDPLQLANINGEWFLFAYCHLRKDVRTFVPARMGKVELTGKKFKPVKEFSLDRQLKNSFGVMTGDREWDVVIRFSSRVADYIIEKRWPGFQKIEHLAKGGVKLYLRLNSLVEIKRWVLGWAGDAVVLQPKELADAVMDSARSILKAQG